MKYRKKPIVIEAVLWVGSNVHTVDNFIRGTQGPEGVSFIMGDHVHLSTLDGMMTASIGDWIIKDVGGEVYPCKPSIFTATYEPA